MREPERQSAARPPPGLPRGPVTGRNGRLQPVVSTRPRVSAKRIFYRDMKIEAPYPRDSTEVDAKMALPTSTYD